MKISILAALSQVRRVGLRPFVLLFLTASVLPGSTACAEEKPSEASHMAGWVVIPVDEYKVLRAKAYPVEPDPEPPPIDATLTRVEYELHVVGALAAGRANLTVDVLKDGWVRVPVPTGLLVREARLDGKLVSLVPSSQGKSGSHLAALLSHPGRWILELDVDVPITASTGDESLALPSTESGVTRASVQLSRNGIDLRVGGGLISEKSESSRGDQVSSLRSRQRATYLHLEEEVRGSSG